MMTKRTFTAVAAAAVLAAVLTGCSGSVYYEDPMDPMYRGQRLHHRGRPGQRYQPGPGAGALSL